ncbi:MAG: hypothetical protein M3Z01_05655 [Thermoproteota archaeon]|nr:hypothetical protein [Thermoproteota archaeon]
MIITIPLILAVGVIVVLSNANVSVFGQQANQTMAQANQTMAQANQTMAQANQTMMTPQNQTMMKDNQTMMKDNQTMTKNNQTATTKDSKSKMNEKLLNYTNTAILSMKSKNKTGERDSLMKIQQALINASGKQLVVVPSDAMTKSKTK